MRDPPQANSPNTTLPNRNLEAALAFITRVDAGPEYTVPVPVSESESVSVLVSVSVLAFAHQCVCVSFVSARRHPSPQTEENGCLPGLCVCQQHWRTWRTSGQPRRNTITSTTAFMLPRFFVQTPIFSVSPSSFSLSLI